MNTELRTSNRRRAAVTLLLGLLAGYAAFIYYGFGPYPRQAPVPWWQPRGFLTESVLLAPFGEDPLPPIVAYTLPAVALALAVLVASPSALLRTGALAITLATGLFLFYGLRWPGPQIWSFFGWRGGAVMLAMAGVVSAALMSPALASAWLKRSWAVRILTYLPCVILAAVFAANATGTNPELPFNISPWPVVSVFGMDLSASIIAALFACAGLALAALRWRDRALWVTALCLTAAITVPVVWVVLDLPSGLWLLAAALAVAAAALVLAARADGNLTMGSRSIAGYVALGSILVTMPLLLGSTWKRLDYSATRADRAQQIIDALADYYEREGAYPDELDELVESRDIDDLPKPRIGLAALSGQEFTYQSFGTDYLLEFAAPGWTQCAYSPPWEQDWENEDDADSYPPSDAGAEEPAGDFDPEAGLGPAAAGLPPAEEEFDVGGLGPAAAGLPPAEEEFDVGGLGPAAAGLPSAEEEIPVEDERLEGSWTCPSKPPELW